MKGLIIKDFYTLSKQMRMFFFILIIWAIIPNFQFSGFAIMYASMLPITAIAYDERSKWNTLCAMMPYSAKDIVLSKYIMVYMFTAATSLLCVVSRIIVSVFNIPIGNSDESLLVIPVIFILATIIESINLPLIFKVGVEKGRLFFIFLFVVILLSAGLVSSRIGEGYDFSNQLIYKIIFICLAFAVIVNVLSILISIKVYNDKVK